MPVLWGVRWMSIPGKPPLRPLLLSLRVLKLFASGKQLSYDTQLDLKRNVIVKAYRNFSGTISAVPSVVYLLNNGYRIGRVKSTCDRYHDTLSTTIRVPNQDHSSLQRTTEEGEKGRGLDQAGLVEDWV